MNKWMKKLTAALCAAVLMCGMAVTAYAGGGDMGYPAKSEDFVGRGGATEQSECSPQGGCSGAEFVTTRDGLAPVEPLPAETIEPSEGFTEDGNLVTRDLLYADADKIVLVMDNLNTILPPLSTKRFHLRRHTVLRRSLRSITRQNMGHGWIWLKLSCPRLLFNAF